ncbi:ABC transporter ATP-binding protein [Streptococcus criceti]|uniref:Homoserine kinase family protein n=1 Tax=Streptococcus criceti HS-6 TaxID=873449 RepID=G5JRC6_STRCG|nr:ABC transporter ATP-binding protein [Streptococcus criceti]EHI75374.1 homoserine kinase family protein [Streptococcus criceti HS-6]SUN43752.1 ABC transporter ATP-binding protein [Streptococcus criceti]
MVETILTCKQIVKHFKTKSVLKGVDLTIRAGRILALLGPNGTGKTTLIRTILGLLKADSGTVELFGETLTTRNRTDLLKHIGVQNDGNLYEQLSVKENLRIWGQLYGLDASDIEQAISEVVRCLDLVAYLNEPVGKLSKGNRQKAALARAILHQPKLLILDEPTTGLDPQMVESFLSYLKELVASRGTTVLMCTHQLHGLEEIVDEVAIMSEGKILLAGDLQPLLASYDDGQPLHLEVEPLAIGKTLAQLYGEASAEKGYLLVKNITRQGIPNLVRDLTTQGCQLYSLVRESVSLTDLYLEVIGGAKDE